MSDEESAVISLKPVTYEAVLSDVIGIKAKAALGMRGVFLNAKHPKQADKLLVWDGIGSALSLSASDMYDHLPENECERFASGVIKNSGNYLSAVPAQDQMLERKKLAMIVSKIRGFSVDKAQAEIKSDIVKQALLSAVIECGNKPLLNGENYTASLKRVAQAQLRNESNGTDELSKLLDSLDTAIDNGIKPKKLFNLKPDEIQKLSEAAVECAHQFIDETSNLEKSLKLANNYVKEKLIPVNLKTEEAASLNNMLDTIEDLWSLGGDNANNLKTKFITTPPASLSSDSNANTEFNKICLALCAISTEDQIENAAKKNSLVESYNIILKSMKVVGGKREYSQKKDLIEALLPQIAKINPSDLEKNKKEITKLCAQTIDKYSSKSLPLIGDNTVSIKDGNVDKMKSALETSLAKFHRIPEQDMDSRSLPGGMPLPSSRPVVDTSKARVNEPNLKQSRPPQTPFPGTPSRPVSATPKSESPKVVTAKSLAQWEQSELMPAGMPQTQTAQDKSIKKSPNELLLESKDRLRQELTQWEKNYKNGRNLPKPPSKNSDVGKSVKAWREWYNTNTAALTTKGFNIPHNYKDVYEISSKYNTHDSLSILSALQKEARGRGEARSQAIVGKTSKAISVTPTTFGKEGVSINESEPSTPPPAPNAAQKKPKERIH